MGSKIQLSPTEILNYLKYVRSEVSRVYRKTMIKVTLVLTILLLTAILIPTIEKAIVNATASEAAIVVVYIFILILAILSIHYFAKISDYKQIIYSVDRYIKRTSNSYLKNEPEELNYIFGKFIKSICRTLKINREKMISYLVNHDLQKAL